MRRLYCSNCGTVRPTPYEDAARGLTPRRVHGWLLHDIICDGCGKDVSEGSPAVAESVPKDMRPWESNYMEVRS